jgi:hypothetical protein
MLFSIAFWAIPRSKKSSFFSPELHPIMPYPSQVLTIFDMHLAEKTTHRNKKALPTCDIIRSGGLA